ncbi:MAG: hypothetical protein RL092_882 [Bacteroidota bacterium]|jgi:hypothetical protein
MTFKLSIILGVALLFISTSLFSQEQSKDVTITATGSGSTQSEAKQMALRGATEQAYGAFISSKTEIFNDQLVADQMSSISSGNIKSFEVLSESQLPNGTWASTIKAIVSVDKLTSFVQAKGIAVEVKGGLFAVNIKQQMLNEEGEVKAIADMVGMLHEIMQTAFDYEIQTQNPVSLDSENKNWKIDYEISVKTNANMEFCTDYIIKTLRAIGLSDSEVENYTTLQKQTFHFKVKYYFEGQQLSEDFYLRKSETVRIINAFLGNVPFYTTLFTVQSGIANKNVKINEGGSSNTFGSLTYSSSIYASSYSVPKYPTLDFPKGGAHFTKFKLSDFLTLSQIEQITTYSVAPRGVVSHFKHGGYVIYEKNGEGLVCSILDANVKEDNRGNAINSGPDKPYLSLNGYSDWELPSKEEMKMIQDSLVKLEIGILAAPAAYLTKSRMIRRFGNIKEAKNLTTASPISTESIKPDSITYVNSLKYTLVIRNKKDNSFEYTLYNQCQVGSCAGLDNIVGEASSTQTEPSSEKIFEEPGVMLFNFLENGKTIILEPDPSLIGFDCAGEFDNSFELQVK